MQLNITEGSQFGQGRINKHPQFGQDGVTDWPDPALGQTGPVLGTQWWFSAHLSRQDHSLHDVCRVN